MKATEILDKLKQVLMSSDAVVVEAETEQKIEMKSEEVSEIEADIVKEEVKEDVLLAENTEEEKVEEVVKEEQAPTYATLSDLTSLKNEILDMLAAFAEVSKEYKKEVPSELSKEKEIEVNVELSAEEEVKEIQHSPESNVQKQKLNRYSTRKPITTQDRVFAKLFNKN